MRKKAKIKVTIVCPWWRRWEVTLRHSKSMVRFMREAPPWVDINYLCIISPEDKDYTELLDIGHEFNFTVTQYKNLPIGAKLNAGIQTAIALFKPDYIMNMGSDDLCDASVWKEYKPHVEAGNELIGIDSCHIVDPETNQAYYLDLYNHKYPVGVMRLIKVEAITRLQKKYKLPLYHYNLDRGMDTASMNRLMKIGVRPTMIHTDWRPFTTGFKSNISINHFQFLSSIEKAKPVDIDVLKNLLK